MDYLKIIQASKFSIRNRDQLAKSKMVGCYYCLKIFEPSEIQDWTDFENTAICPYCAIDSVLGDASPYEISKESLKELKGYWFRG
jgi:hypothetical protein